MSPTWACMILEKLHCDVLFTCKIYRDLEKIYALCYSCAINNYNFHHLGTVGLSPSKKKTKKKNTHLVQPSAAPPEMYATMMPAWTSEEK